MRSSGKRRLFAVAAGIPPQLGGRFEDLFHKRTSGWRIIARGDVDPWKSYTRSYADGLYGRLFEKLRKLELSDRRNMLAGVNLILLCLVKNDGSESILLERFGIETLVIPLSWPNVVGMAQATGNEQGRAVNALVRRGVRSVRDAERLLAVIGEEVSNRDNRTCLLLPPKNFGRGGILDCVHSAVLEGKDASAFRGDLRRMYRSLGGGHGAKHTCFVGERGLEFNSPSRRARHGVGAGLGRGRARPGLCASWSITIWCALRSDVSLRLPPGRCQVSGLSKLSRQQETATGA